MARKKARKAPQRVSWWNTLASSKQHLLCLLALIAVALYFCWPTLFSGRYLVGGDTIQWRATAESMLQHRHETGEEPLWTNNVFGGMPGLVISPPGMVAQVDFLFGWLRLASWPLSHVIALLLGAYALVWYVTRDKLLGLFSACAYGLTTYLPIIIVAGHNTKFVALAYAPWLLVAFINTMRRPGLLASLLFAVAVAVSMRAGHVQISYYVGMIGLVWWIVELVCALRKGTLQPFAKATLWLLTGFTLGVAMVAQIYWPTYEYKGYTMRGMASGGGAGALGWDYAMAWSQGRAELLTLLIADAFGGGGSQYWGGKSFTAGPHYVGGVVLLFSLLAVWRLRTRAVAALGTAAVVMTLFALGNNFEVLNRLMHNHFPLFDAFRVPETWLIAVAMALAVLAALGLGYVIRREDSSGAEARKSHRIYAAAATLIGFVLLMIVGKGALLSFERPEERAQYQALIAQQAQRPMHDADVVRATDEYLATRLVGPREEAFTRDAMRTLAVLLLTTGGLVLYRRRKIPAWLLQAVLITLVTIDLGGVARRYFNEDHLSARRDAAARIQTLDVDQFLLQAKNEAGGAGHFRVLSLEVFDQTKNARPSFHHESLGGYSGAKLRLYQDFLEHILFDPDTRSPNANALDMMNARYVIARGEIEGTQPVFRGSQYMVLENSDALPRAFLVGETEVIRDPKDTWARLQDASFDPHRTAILSAPFQAEVAPIDSSSVTDVSLQRYGPREMAFEVETDQPRLLLISEVYYPAGWHATLDGVETPIYRANYLLRAVHVPAGTHEVVLRFDPKSYFMGNWISVVSTLLVYLSVIALGARAWRNHR